MAKKTEEVYEDYDEDQDPTDALNSMDFNVEDEYKPDPLIPKGTYHGGVTDVKFNPQQHCIVWTVCLHDNGGVQNDNETPIDGALVWFRNWLPKAGDEDIPTKSGKTNKRQSKINMLRDFGTELGIDVSTPQAIGTAISEAQWVGLEVELDSDIDEYNGKFRNQVNRMRKSKMY